MNGGIISLCPQSPGAEERYFGFFVFVFVFLCVFKERGPISRKELSDLLKPLKIISNYINDAEIHCSYKQSQKISGKTQVFNH